MSNIDFTQAIGSDALAAKIMVEYASAIKTECGRRIYAVADEVAQRNMSAVCGAGLMDADTLATYRAGLLWVGAMRAACRDLIANASMEYLDDAAWPAVPEGVAELADKY